MLNTGKLAFGVSSGAQQIVNSPLAYNDNSGTTWLPPRAPTA